MLITPRTKLEPIRSKRTRNTNIIWGLMLILLCLEVIRDSFKSGDFSGYIEVGTILLSQGNIYATMLNTWPPFFSIFCIPMVWVEKLLGGVGIRFLWELGSVLSFFYLVSLTSSIVLGRKLNYFGKSNQGISIRDSLILVPILLSLRFVLDNLANIQINIYLLLASILIIKCYFEKRFILLGFILALSISLKVLPIFLFFYFLLKREFKPVAWTLLFLVLINMITLAVFGIEQGLNYYYEWVTEIAPKGYTVNRKNQSMFGALLRFFTDENYNQKMLVNFISLPFEQAKHLIYIIFGIASLGVAYFFRKRISSENKLQTILEFSIVLSAIPLLSPLSWKAYFIFLWLSIFVTYLLLYRVDSNIRESNLKLMKVFFWTSSLLCIGSSQLFLGKHLSRVLESWSLIPIGGLILIIVQISIHIHLSKFNQHITRLSVVKKED